MALALSLLLAPSSSGAVTRSALGAAAHDRLEALIGFEPLRGERTLSHGAPRPREAAPFARLAAEVGGSARASWDPATHVPSRTWGAGVAVPRAAQVAHARAALDRNLELLAPGASPADFALVTDDVGRGATGAVLRTIAFAQSSPLPGFEKGLPVVGGQVSFRFVADRLVLVASEAVPYATAREGTLVDDDLARAEAEAALTDAASSAEANTVEGPMVLPLVRASGALDLHTVLRVRVEAEPLGRWDVWVDAHTGQPVARQQLLHFASGAVTLDVPERWPGAGRKPYPMQRAKATIDGAPSQTDEQGSLTWASAAPAAVDLELIGPWVNIVNDDGDDATQTLTLDPGGTYDWNQGGEPPVDAQLSIFVHLQRAKERILSISPTFDFPLQQIEGHANVPMACNSFSDGTNVFLFRAGFGCANMGRIADVIYHEYGHSAHAHAIVFGAGLFDGALSEGVSDYLASTMTGDSGMGRGFFDTPEPLRDIDPQGFEYQWPADVDPDTHVTGLIIAGALWDLRTLLAEKLGEPAGVALADRLYFEGHRRAVDIPTVYPEVLVADDDDGDLANGTPHVCEIDEAFAAHGLKALSGAVTELGPQAASQDGYEVTAAIDGMFSQCAGQDAPVATLRWRPRGKPQQAGDVVMTQPSPGVWKGTLPPQPEGTLLEYQVAVDLGAAGQYLFPKNPADRWYELWVGATVPLYCTDFELDPEEQGWTHGYDFADPMEPTPDDWRWGPVNSKLGSGDPTYEYSGARVFGNDLGGAGKDGSYPPYVRNWALSPEVDLQGMAGVRLQYRRWLEVQAGFADRAAISAYGKTVWDNDGDVDHRDGEWRFHDADLTARVKSGKIQVRFEIESDQSVQYGGWTLDDFCLVGWTPPVPAASCGNGAVEDGEGCDEGFENDDTKPDACREDCQPARCGDGVVDAGEACDDGGLVAGDGCSPACTSEEPTGSLSAEGGCVCSVPTGGDARVGWRAWVVAGALLAGLRRRRRR